MVLPGKSFDVLALCRRPRMDVVVLPSKKVMAMGGKPVQRNPWSMDPTGRGTKCKLNFRSGGLAPKRRILKNVNSGMLFLDV